MHGIVDEKTDVFAYGVLLLELITGRRAVDSSQQSLVIWVWFRILKTITDLDPNLLTLHENPNLEQLANLMKYIIIQLSLCAGKTTAGEEQF